jgi:hypothetical protein
VYVDYVGRLERISRTSRSKPFWKLPQLPVEIRLLQHEEAAAKHRQPNVHPRAAREDKSWRAAALEHLGTSWNILENAKNVKICQAAAAAASIESPD